MRASAKGLLSVVPVECKWESLLCLNINAFDLESDHVADGLGASRCVLLLIIPFIILVIVFSLGELECALRFSVARFCIAK